MIAMTTRIHLAHLYLLFQLPLQLLNLLCECLFAPGELGH